MRNSTRARGWRWTGLRIGSAPLVMLLVVALVGAPALAAPGGPAADGGPVEGMPYASTTTAALTTTDPSAGPAPHGPHFVRGGDAVMPATRPVVLPDGRTAHETGFVPFATFGAITLSHPAAIVEQIGLHQSNHEGARDLALADTAATSTVLPFRGRLSGRQSAADVVVPPDTELRSPVTGTVLRAGTYVLYCEHADDFLVVAPDDDPTLEVKVLHIDGVTVAAGDRVAAGRTVIAPRATVLPFSSQVDATTADPAWPHTHIEVIDPAIDDVANGGSGSGC